MTHYLPNGKSCAFLDGHKESECMTESKALACIFAMMFMVSLTLFAAMSLVELIF